MNAANPRRNVGQFPWQTNTIDLPIVGDDIAWQERGACRQVGGDAWFPDQGDNSLSAKKVCKACPVRQECLEYALDHAELEGLWGGVGERMRRKLRADRAAGLEVAA